MRAAQLLSNLGQSIWLDNITRELLDTGTLTQHIDEYSVTGLNSNRTIFERAIKNNHSYDAPLQKKLANGTFGEELFFELALEDITRAADLFRPIYDRSNTVDGWASLEVSPLLAHYRAGAFAAAKDLFACAKRPNLLIKIPGAKEGLLAVEAADAFLRGVERRLFYQLIHHGTRIAPCDFVVFGRSLNPIGRPHDMLIANVFTQAEALAFGKTSAQVKAERIAGWLVPHRVFDGNRPSNTILAERLTPEVLGKLVALYERSVFTQRAVWQINPFDQWGVELGKVLAQRMIPEIESEVEPKPNHDSSTNALIRRYRKYKETQ